MTDAAHPNPAPPPRARVSPRRGNGEENSAATDPTRAEEGEIIRHNGGWLKPWRKGQSGNPTGTQGEYYEVRRICASHSVEATRKLIELLHDDDSRVRFMAIKEIHDRGIGKPRDHSNEADGRMDLSALSHDERQTLAALLAKAEEWRSPDPGETQWFGLADVPR